MRTSLLLFDGFFAVNLRLHPNDVYLLLQFLYDQVEFCRVVEALLASQNIFEQLAGSTLRQESQRIHLSLHVVLHRYDGDNLWQNLWKYRLVHLPQSDFGDIYHVVDELTQKLLAAQKVVFGTALFNLVVLLFDLGIGVQSGVLDDLHLLVLS